MYIYKQCSRMHLIEYIMLLMLPLLKHYCHAVYRVTRLFFCHVTSCYHVTF